MVKFRNKKEFPQIIHKLTKTLDIPNKILYNTRPRTLGLT